MPEAAQWINANSLASASVFPTSKPCASGAACRGLRVFVNLQNMLGKHTPHPPGWLLLTRGLGGTGEDNAHFSI